MKRKYETAEWEVISFANVDMRMVSSSCPTDCPDDCSVCYYLVCQPQDVIIG